MDYGTLRRMLRHGLISVETARANLGLPPSPSPSGQPLPQQQAPSSGPAWGQAQASQYQAPAYAWGGPIPAPPAATASQPPATRRGTPGISGFSSAPLIAAGVCGYRWWTLDAPGARDLFASPSRSSWKPGLLRGMRDSWQPGLNNASCVAGAGHTAEQVPVEDCGCVTPETRVLTADLRWVPAGDLAVGEHLLAFDEYPADRGRGRAGGRKYRDAVVASTERGLLPCYDLEFEDGTAVRVSADHRWLIYSGQKGAHWVRTDELRAGKQRASRVVKPFTPWETNFSREAGYLAAAFDGEGHLTQLGPRYAFRVGFSQADNPMLAETERCLKELGFEFAHRVKTRHKLLRADGSSRLDNHLLELTARPEMLRFLGVVRPARLLPKFRPGLLGRMNMANRVRLVRKVYAGQQEVVKLGTTAGTYFAEGFASHNCGFWAYWQVQSYDIGAGGTALPVVGVIEGQGQVLVGELGFRAQRARIVALHLPFQIEPDLPRVPGREGPSLLDHGQPRAYGRHNPWYNHPRFHGRVISYGPAGPRQRVADVLRDAPPEPSAEDIAEARDRAEAWMAVIGDYLAVTYPDAEVCQTLALLLARYPPDSRHLTPVQCPACLEHVADIHAHSADCLGLANRHPGQPGQVSQFPPPR